MASQPCRNALARSRHIIRPKTFARNFAFKDTAPPTEQPESFNPETRRQPRWQATPEGMVAPFRVRVAKNPVNSEWAVNSDPKVLDEFYESLLGPEGPNMLPEELKWLAITHKSFDQAKRGNNERLAMMGRMAIYMEACKTTVNSERNPKLGEGEDVHPQLRSVDNLHIESPTSRVASSLLATAQKTNLLMVLRWKPRLTQDLEQSGVSTISSRAVQAIVGAILLQHGSEVASTVIRERILQAPRRSAA
ncbi:uncharacterized protein J7T54_008052 [Emericellopsis cladophorae]|uniref:RNase III domain-containing protein n=1 Tax=Emericellopsis cladophorae TaxID=2686198 RepID=A0A9P9Y8C9_9HYPO|nr:uncharacterized protein J7T54_008052 [Emericellopsis cladophorae]KAI6784958.1 hypothetical protein J7T54_008052 [Emericellopsis cladophorae]